MTLPSSLVHRLRNVSARELVEALERDGFSYRRGRGSGRVYRHLDGRRVVIHYHWPNDRLPRGTLGDVIAGASWTEADARRLGLI